MKRVHLYKRPGMYLWLNCKSWTVFLVPWGPKHKKPRKEACSGKYFYCLGRF